MKLMLTIMAYNHVTLATFKRHPLYKTAADAICLYG